MTLSWDETADWSVLKEYVNTRASISKSEMRYGCQFKMGLTGLNRSVTFVHLTFSSRSLDVSYFFVSDVFMRSTLFLVIRALFFQLFD